MNVLNEDAVAAFCEAVSARAGHPALATWCERNLRRHVLRSPEFHAVVALSELGALQAAGEIAEVPRWASEAAARGDQLAVFRPEAAEAQSLARDAWRVVDHRNAVPLPDMSRVSVPEAVVAAEAWEREEAARRVEDFARRRRIPVRAAAALLSRIDPGVGRLWPESAGDVRVLASLPDGHALVEVATRDALVREGTLMDHCVATYWDDVSDGTVRILSLREPGNLPLATLEVSGLGGGGRGIHRIVRSHLPAGLQVAWQIRGISNAAPIGDACRRLSALMDATGICASDSEVAWLGLEPRHAFMSRLDLGGLASSMPAFAGEGRASSGFLAAARLLLDRLDDLDDGQCEGIVASLGPPAGIGPEADLVSVEPEATRLTWRVPNLLLTSRLSGLLSRAPDAVRDAFMPLAMAIVETAEARPDAIHAVRPTLGGWASERPFMAWCGLDARWGAALARSASTRREALRARQADYKRRLRRADLDPEERARLQNAVGVLIPRLMSGVSA